MFRVPQLGVSVDHATPNYLDLTKGTHTRGADTQKGMFFYAGVREPGQNFNRLPAFLFHSNPYKKDTEGTPWIDIVEPDVGYALYHGDNKTAGCLPLQARGNHKFAEVQHFYTDPKLREFAPPVLLFTQQEVDGRRQGYREFAGYGVPVRCAISTQREKRSKQYFTNLAIELALFHLESENELFPWSWIDARRNPKLSGKEVLVFAPLAWKEWVRRGDSAIERCRRSVARYTVQRRAEQRPVGANERRHLEEVHRYFELKKHPFEGLASYVAARIIGHNCKRGWVTKRSGDMGIDFVCRLDVGDPGSQLSRTPIVVLGQAKCQRSLISAPDLARVVARLQRGWMGVYVTTSEFSEPAQLELAQDKYPLLLVNGKRLIQELERAAVAEGLTLQELLIRETDWYHANERPYSPARILEDSIFSSQTDSVQQDHDEAPDDSSLLSPAISGVFQR